MESLDFMVAQSFAIPSTQTLEVTDVNGIGRTADIQTGGPFYYRIFLANTGDADGSERYPFDLLRQIENVLWGAWEVTLNAQGCVKFTYTGTGTGTVLLPFNLRTMLGFLGAIGPLATGASQAGYVQPTHCVFSLNFSGDEGWNRRPPRTASQTLPNGKVYGWTDRTPGAIRRVSFQLHPKSQVVKDAYNALNPGDPMLATPVYPPDSRFLDPFTGEPFQSTPWSVLDTLNIQLDQSLGVAWGNLPDIIAGTGPDLTYDVCFITPDALKSGGTVAPSVTNWDARYDVRDVEFNLFVKGDIR